MSYKISSLEKNYNVKWSLNLKKHPFVQKEKKKT